MLDQQQRPDHLCLERGFRLVPVDLGDWDVWTAFVVTALDPGPKRFSELKAHIRGITPNALTETLRAMEYDGLISRKSRRGNPPHVEYALTPLGRSLLVPLSAVQDWAETHVPDIERARTLAHASQPTR